MGLYIKIPGGTWSPALTARIKTGVSTWSSVVKGFVKTAADTWSQFFPGGLIPVIAAQVTIAKSGSGTITLTGTNRRWTNFSTGVYYFDSSTDNSNWTQMDTGAITNPAVAGTNTKTYVLTQYDVTANTTNYYRFRVEVTSSTPVTATSTSTSTTVEGTRDITDLSATASLLYGSVIDLSWTASVYAGSQRVQYKLSSSGTWTTFSTVSGITTSASVTGLTGGGISYDFRILPYTGASATGYYGNYSNTATASTYAGNPYTFNFGNTIYIGTNGYISFDYGRVDTSIGLVLGRALSMLAADLVQDNLSLAASGSMQYIFWRGHRYGNNNTAEIRLEIQIPNAGNYAYIEYTFTTAVSPRNSSTISTDIGYYVDGIGPSGGYSNISSSILTTQQVLIYFGFGTSSGPGSGIFSSQGISWAGWIAFDTVTSGGLDDGYYALTTVAGSSPGNPINVANSNVTSTSATVDWASPVTLGGSKILSYDWSTDQVNWTNTGLTTTASVTGLSASTSYTVYIRANNHFFTGTSYGTTTFTTTSAPVNTVIPSLSTNTGNFSNGSIITVASGTWTGATSYTYEILYSSNTPVPTNSLTKAVDVNNQYTISNSDASNPSYYFRAKVTAYSGASQTGSSAIAYGDTSSRSYINPSTSISVGSATTTGFTITGTASPVSGGIAWVSVSAIYIYNSSQSLIATISSSLPSVNASTGAWSYTWTGGSSNTTYYAKAQVTATDSAATAFTTSFSSSITTTTAFVTPSITLTTNPPAFARGGAGNNIIGWGWNNASYSGSTSGNPSYPWRIRSGSSSGTIINSGTRSYSTGSINLGGTNYNYRIGSEEGDTPRTTAARFGSYQATILGTNGQTYSTSYSASS